MDETRKFFVLTIANEVRQIIRSAGAVSMSWGISHVTGTEYEGMAALFFMVQGFKHRGAVVVALNEAKDLYEVYLLGKDAKPVKCVENVYLDTLVSVLDAEIETGGANEKEYTEKVNKWLENQKF